MRGSAPHPPPSQTGGVASAAPRFTSLTSPATAARSPGRPGAARAAGGATAVAPAVSSGRPARASVPARPRSAAAASAPKPAPYVGMALSPNEIQGILAHAGSGCPLGPCRGCPHMEVTTGACMA